MALIDASLDADNPLYVGFRANNAPEMALLLAQWFADNPDLQIKDIELSATGAAPNFLCTVVAGGEGGTTPEVLGSAAIATVIGGVGQVDAIAMAAELGVAVRDLAPDAETLYKSVSAGGGAGPHWMALALTDGNGAPVE